VRSSGPLGDDWAPFGRHLKCPPLKCPPYRLATVGSTPLLAIEKGSAIQPPSFGSSVVSRNCAARRFCGCLFAAKRWMPDARAPGLRRCRSQSGSNSCAQARVIDRGGHAPGPSGHFRGSSRPAASHQHNPAQASFLFRYAPSVQRARDRPCHFETGRKRHAR